MREQEKDYILSSMRQKVEKYKSRADLNEYCVTSAYFKTKGGFWKIAFFALISSAISFFGLIQILFPIIVELFAVDFLLMVMIVIGSGMFFLVVLILGVKLKLFKTIHVLMVTGLTTAITSTGIVGIVANKIPIDGFEIFKYFAVLLPLNIFIIILAFYLTRKIICNSEQSNFIV